MQSEVQADVVVCGGGLAGTLAAIATKRTCPQADVWLIERFGFLGGMATAGYVYPFMRYFSKDPLRKTWKRLTGGLFKELVDLLHAAGYTERRHKRGLFTRFDPHLLRAVLDQMVINSGVKLLFYGVVNEVGVAAKGGGGARIQNVVAQTKRGPIAFLAKYFIDATGDADVSFHAGVTTEMGRPSDGLVQPATLMFRMGRVARWAPRRRRISKKIRKEKSRGNPLTPRDDCLMFGGISPVERHFNQTRVAGFDFTDPFEMTQAELVGREQAESFIHFLRSRIPGYRKSTVASLGTQLGVRETRRIVGEYVLTEADLMRCVQFPDRVALGNYPIDIHDPKGTARTDIRRIPPGRFYSIPFRSLIPKGVSNLLVAGRPISATHVAHSAIRIMPICAAIGHAAGCATGIACTGTSSPRPTFRELDASKLQAVLRSQGAILE